MKKLLTEQRKNNFKQNILRIKQDFYFKFIAFLFVLIFFCLKILPIFGIYFSFVGSNSDTNGIYITFKENNKYIYKKGDYVSYCLTNKNALSYAFKFGLPQKNNQCSNGSAPLLKHVCGTPNETIVFKDNKFYNGSIVISQDYYSKINSMDNFNWNKQSYKIPEQNYFICGTNNLSFDSRYYGSINSNDIIGRSYLLIPLPQKDFEFGH